MIRVLTCTGLILSVCCPSFGQTAATPGPSFEVASIKPSPPPSTPGMIRIGVRPSPGRITYSGMPLKNLIQSAYRVKSYQVSGPAWLDSERFEIIAKLPEGASQEQVPEMLQKLLQERFGLKLHRETKELPIYALVVGKNGPKLEEVADAPGGPGPGGAGPGGMMRIEPGKMTADRVKMSGFVDLISRLVDRPVIDETKLTGTYKMTVEFSPEDFMNMKNTMRMGGPGGPGVGPGAGPGTGPATGPAPESAPATSIFQSVQKLGLKLDARKAPIEFLVVDHVEKTPTEN